MSANLKKVTIPDTLFEFFKQSDPNTNYLFKLKIRGDAYSTHYKEKWLAAKVVMNFNEGNMGLEDSNLYFMRLRKDSDLEDIADMYEIDELFDVIAGKAK